MEDREELEKTWSRESRGLREGMRSEATPVALVRSVTQRTDYSNPKNSRLEKAHQQSRSTTSIHDFLEKERSTSRESLPMEENNPSAPEHHQRHVIRFEDGDPENPNNWPQIKKLYALFVAIISVLNSTMTSSLAAGGSGPLSKHYGVTSDAKLILPTSMYLVGYVVGPMVWGPVSETYGRKWTMIAAFALFSVFSIASAVAPNWAALVIFRLFTGSGGSCAISVVGGICADIYHDPVARGRSMAIFMAATMFGPIIGPPASGFVSTVSWSWTFWIGVIFAGVSWPLFFFYPETYAPTILKHRAQRLRKETGDDDIVAPIELEETDLRHIVTVVLSRPLRMFCFEPLVLFTCLYLSYAYAIFYIYLQAYPIIFSGVYGFKAGIEGLMFIPIGVGAIISAVMYLSWDEILRRAQAAKKPWSQREEMRRLPLACIAGPFFVVSSFWLGWTARASIHWIVPALAGVLFGMGYLCLFMALLNYLVDAYEIFAASAMAASSLTRSSFGAVLPLAAKPMYDTLGIAWATSLLGFFSLALCVIPFVFLRFGSRLREKSEFCQYLAQKKREEEESRRQELDLQGQQETVENAAKSDDVV